MSRDGWEVERDAEGAPARLLWVGRTADHRTEQEVGFFNALRSIGRHPGIDAMEAITAKLAIPINRREYLLEKWSRKGWWNSGVSPRSGWFEDTAPERLWVGGRGPTPNDPEVLRPKLNEPQTPEENG